MMYEFLKNHTVRVWLLIALATGCPALTVALEQAMTTDGILDITLANLTIQPFKSGPAPDNWFLVEEVATKGEVIRTPGTENTAMYRRSSE